MIPELNDLGQPVGFVVPNWSPRPLPPKTPIEGRYCRVVPLDPELHAANLYAANSEDKEGRMWSYIPPGPFRDFNDYAISMKRWLTNDEWYIYAIVDRTHGAGSGVVLYKGVKPDAGSVEIGVMFSPLLQRTTAATEAMYLLRKRAFDELGYRRYEWKCDALNEASIRAAKRLGFQFERIFRQADVLKGRSCDAAWFSIIDRDWPRLSGAFERWLARENFDEKGRQLKTLVQLREENT
jgi:RimJ/RimL family protein N-acetyltransferase